MNETTQPAVAGPVEPTVRRHTPGPWRPHFEEAYFVTGPDLGCVAMMMNLKGAHGLGGRRSGDESAANCRLIAAAPDLLAVVAAYVEHFERNHITNTHGARDFDFTGHIAALARAAMARTVGDA